jgi:hypothetical protein
MAAMFFVPWGTLLLKITKTRIMFRIKLAGIAIINAVSPWTVVKVTIRALARIIENIVKPARRKPAPMKAFKRSILRFFRMARRISAPIRGSTERIMALIAAAAIPPCDSGMNSIVVM